jgi:hypothetical protein
MAIKKCGEIKSRYKLGNREWKKLGGENSMSQVTGCMSQGLDTRRPNRDSGELRNLPTSLTGLYENKKINREIPCICVGCILY